MVSRRAAFALAAAALFVAPTLGGAALLGGPSAAPAGLLVPVARPGLRTPDLASLEGHAPEGAAVSPPASRAPLAAPVNWTVLVYMVADNDLERYAMEDLNEMELAPASAAVNIVVQVDRSRNYDTTNGDWNETRRYHIGHDNDAATFTSTLVGSLGELNMGDPQTLANFLAWGTDTYPAEHTLVVLWDHGFGWSGGFGDDLGDNDHLSVGELQEGLRAGAAHLGRPFDILAFDACLMQSVEVGYELAWVGDYLVAAQDLEPVTGWPYAAMLAPLIASPEIVPEALAEAMVSAYLDAHGLQSETMMSATRSATVRTSLADALNLLALEIGLVVENPGTANATSAQRALLDARAGTPPMYTGEAFDLGEYLRLLSEDARLPGALRTAASAAREAMNSSMVAEGHSQYYPGWSGLSIHLPSISISPRYLATDYAADGWWDEAMGAALSGVPAGGTRPSIQVLAPAPASAVAPRFLGSAQALAGAAEPVRIQFKAGWNAYRDLASGPAPLQFAGVLDSGRPSGEVVLAFRAVRDTGVPSATVERRVFVEAVPVTLAPATDSLALAVNRTRTLNLTLTPRAPYQAFDIGWMGLPSGISGAGTTGTVSLPTAPPPPFNITLSLAVDAAAPEGTFPATLFVRTAAAPSVASFLDLDLIVTRPLPDLAVAEIALSQDLPLPGERVDATTTVSNLGFEGVADARIVARFTDVNGTPAELANFTTGPMAPGDAVSLAVNFTVERGTQTLEVFAATEPPGAPELNASNNNRARALEVVNFSVAVTGPPGAYSANLGSTPTPVPLTVANRGTDADTYDLSVAALSNVTWQVGLPASTLAIAGRNSSSFSVDVLLPLAAQGGDEATFEVHAQSQADGAVHAFARVRLRVEEVYNATLRPLPAAVELPRGASANVTLTLQNTGNGREAFVIAIETADAKLGTRLDTSGFTLAPGQAGSARLTLTDGGLVASDRPYTVEAVAVSLSSSARFGAIVSVRVAPSPAVSVQALEPTVQTAINGSAQFHARLTNTGNTNVIASVSASAAAPGLTAALPAEATLLEPGAALVLTGNISFSSLPLAGSYPIALTASDALAGANASGGFVVQVPASHDVRGTLSLSPSAVPRTLVRTIVVENLGNTPEQVTVVIGYVPVGIGFGVSPYADDFTVPARSNVTLTIVVTGPQERGESGEIPVALSAQGGTITMSFAVSYDFKAPPPPPIVEWAVILGVAAVATGAWLYATRKRDPPVPPA